MASDHLVATSRAPSKTLVLCLDGTLDRYNTSPSNVARLVSLLEKDDTRQLVYYQAGVGTYVGAAYTNRIFQGISALWDAAVAWNLDEHVMGAYRFLQQNWTDGDRICIFGFSRGAYVARALNGMLFHVGLLPKSMAEEVRFAYSIYRHQKESRDYKRDFARPVEVELMAIFDCVEAVGTMLPRTLPMSTSNHAVKTFRHALSLDEHRAAYQPSLWQRTDSHGIPGHSFKVHVGLFRAVTTLAGNAVRKVLNQTSDDHGNDEEGNMPAGKGTDVREVWFAGCHTNIGGGAVSNNTAYSLQNISLRWMIKEVLEADAGVIFNDDPRLLALGVVLKPVSTSTSDSTKPVKVIEPNGSHAVVPSSVNVPASMVINGTSDPPEPTDNPSPYLPIDARPEDVIAPVKDTLKNPIWWFLEFVPFVTAYQDADDKWHNRIRINLFRGRRIPPSPNSTNRNSRANPDPRGANISSAPALFHVSVRMRMEAPEAAKRSIKTLWTKKSMYRPNARFMTMKGKAEPVYVR